MQISGVGGLGRQLKSTEVSSHPVVEQLEEAKRQCLEKVEFGGVTGEEEGALGALSVAETKDARQQEGQVRGWRGDQALLRGPESQSRPTPRNADEGSRRLGERDAPEG